MESDHQSLRQYVLKGHCCEKGMESRHILILMENSSVYIPSYFTANMFHPLAHNPSLFSSRVLLAFQKLNTNKRKQQITSFLPSFLPLFLFPSFFPSFETSIWLGFLLIFLVPLNPVIFNGKTATPMLGKVKLNSLLMLSRHQEKTKSRLLLESQTSPFVFIPTAVWHEWRPSKGSSGKYPNLAELFRGQKGVRCYWGEGVSCTLKRQFLMKKVLNSLFYRSLTYFRHRKNVTMLCLHKNGECMTKLGVLFGVLTGQRTHHNQRTGPFVNLLLLPSQPPHTSESTCWKSVSLNNMFTRAVILHWLQRLSIAIYPSVLKNHPIGLFRNRISKIQEAAPECNNRAHPPPPWHIQF